MKEVEKANNMKIDMDVHKESESEIQEESDEIPVEEKSCNGINHLGVINEGRKFHIDFKLRCTRWQNTTQNEIMLCQLTNIIQPLSYVLYIMITMSCIKCIILFYLLPTNKFPVYLLTK